MNGSWDATWRDATPRLAPAYKTSVRINGRTCLALAAFGLLAAVPASAQEVAPQPAPADSPEPAPLPAPSGEPGDSTLGQPDSSEQPAQLDPRQARLERARRRAMAQREASADTSRERARRRKDLEERSRAEAEERRGRSVTERERRQPFDARGPDQLVVHLLQLEERILEAQEQMLATLADTMAALENDQDVDRKAAVRKAMGFNARLRHLERQIPRLELALAKLAGEIPGAAQAELQLRRELIHRNLRRISEEHQRVVAAYRDRKGEGDEELEEELEMLEEDTPPEELELPDAPGEEPAPAPDTVEEAAELLEIGEVRTPRHLTELFERIPETETPRGSLRRYRDFIR